MRRLCGYPNHFLLPISHETHGPSASLIGTARTHLGQVTRGETYHPTLLPCGAGNMPTPSHSYSSAAAFSYYASYPTQSTGPKDKRGRRSGIRTPTIPSPAIAGHREPASMMVGVGYKDKSSKSSIAAAWGYTRRTGITNSVRAHWASRRGKKVLVGLFM